VKSLLRLTLLLLSLFVFLQGCGPKYVGPEPLVEDLLADAKKTYEKGKYGEAKEQLEAIKFDYPGNSYIGEVQFYIGMCAYKLKDYPAAEQEFRTVVQEFPATEKYSDDADYHLCLSLFNQSLPPRLDQNHTKKTIEETDGFLETFPGSEFTDSVKTLRAACSDKLAEKEFLAGKLYRRMGYTSSAIHYFKALEKEYPASRWVVRGRYEWALSYYIQKNYTDAGNIADTCAMMIEELIRSENDRIIELKNRGFFYKLVHLFGLVPYDRRSDLKVYVDDLKKDLARLNAKIKKKKAKK
jgi:outer membrane assembly lipoprotein YfiO